MTDPPANALIHETSPYLLQHARNPVQWHPWGDEALERARRENRPVLLSIGYSACHWCHVMAHESFEDPETAAVMNELFVNIKVDREERPDLDRIYQRAHQLLTQRPGGWPLTMFLMADDQVPFFGGTYFPKEPRHGLPAFGELLRRLAEVYHTRGDELRRQNSLLVQALQALGPAAHSQAVLGAAPLDLARGELERAIDWRHGGLGGAPKFPHVAALERLLRHWVGSQGCDVKALQAVRLSLARMAEGGVFDQIGGGFCRYAVDEQWMIPHFEKMLYDNGALLALYAEAWRATADPLFRRTAEQTAEWVLREMQSPQGGYYSSLDADSEGEEGKFYTWGREEVHGLLDENEYAVFARRYGLDRKPNFRGRWYPHTFAEWDGLCDNLDITPQRAQGLLAGARGKLLAAREERVRPGRDDKVLTAWNGLMIKGMAVAGRHLGRPDLIQSADRALAFVRDTLWRGGRLLATSKDGRAHLDAYLDDYVFLMDAVLELLQARWRNGELTFALQLADVVLEHFEDRDRGGFYFTADDHERLIDRPKPMGDESTPAGNGVAACVLGRLGHLLGDARLLGAAERTLRAGWTSMEQLPHAHTALLVALEEYLNPPQTVVLRGSTAAMEPWHRRCIEPYAPRRLTLAIPAGTTDLPGALAERAAGNEPVRAYVCTGTACAAPLTSLDELEALLRPIEVGPSSAG